MAASLGDFGVQGEVGVLFLGIVSYLPQTARYAVNAKKNAQEEEAQTATREFLEDMKLSAPWFFAEYPGLMLGLALIASLPGNNAASALGVSGFTTFLTAAVVARQNGQEIDAHAITGLATNMVAAMLGMKKDASGNLVPCLPPVHA